MATAATTKARKPSDPSGELVCPECGKTFTRAQALGAHRSRAHGVAGTSKSAAKQRRAASAQQPQRRQGSRTTATTRQTASAVRGSQARTSASRDGDTQAVDRDTP